MATRGGSRWLVADITRAGLGSLPWLAIRVTEARESPWQAGSGLCRGSGEPVANGRPLINGGESQSIRRKATPIRS